MKKNPYDKSSRFIIIPSECLIGAFSGKRKSNCVFILKISLIWYHRMNKLCYAFGENVGMLPLMK